MFPDPGNLFEAGDPIGRQHIPDGQQRIRRQKRRVHNIKALVFFSVSQPVQEIQLNILRAGRVAADRRVTVRHRVEISACEAVYIGDPRRCLRDPVEVLPVQFAQGVDLSLLLPAVGSVLLRRIRVVDLQHCPGLQKGFPYPQNHQKNCQDPSLPVNYLPAVQNPQSLIRGVPVSHKHRHGSQHQQSDPCASASSRRPDPP